MSDVPDHLSRISTLWTVFRQAHGDGPSGVSAAQEELVQRYYGAVYRYLHAVTRDDNSAEELAQEFAVRFLRGDFKGADPEKGRFRDYLKRSLFNLIRDHGKTQQKHEAEVAADKIEPVAPAGPTEEEQRFLQSWREELLDRTWEALADFEKETGRLYYAVLDYRTRHPSTSSAAMAEEFSRRLDKNFTAASIRQLIHRAREQFGELLVAEVARSLETVEVDLIEQELNDLELLPYCQDAVQRWSAKQI